MTGVVKIKVGPADAVRVGRVDAAGVHEIQLTDEMIGQLTDAERAELAEALSDRRPLDVSSPDWAAVVEQLRRRVEAAARYEAAEEERRREEAAELLRCLNGRKVRCMRQRGTARASAPEDERAAARYEAAEIEYEWEVVLPFVAPVSAQPPAGWDEWVESLRAESEARRRVAETEALAESVRRGDEAREAAARRDEYVSARSALVAQIGDDNQRSRLREGLLPEDEADAILRDHVFAPVDETGVERFRRLEPWDVHGHWCAGDEDVEFTTSSLSAGLSASEYEALSLIREAASRIDGAEVSARLHTGHCHRCGEEAQRASALVTVRWHGHRLSREYRLG